MEKVKILIVDDSEITLTKVGNFLINDRVDIYTSRSGEEALKRSKKKRIFFIYHRCAYERHGWF